jgi:XTP/dITP diphosphohydrolase
LLESIFLPPKKKITVMELVFATHNLNKVIEVQDMLTSSIQLVGLDQLGFNTEINEDGLDLESNAQIKAMHIYGVFGKNCFADDTGLEVDALNGLPGVYSARYAGEHKSDKENLELLLKKMENKSNRKAQFRTVICLVLEGEKKMFEGVVEGEITTEPRGNGGFGYDSVFIPKGFEITFAEMEPYTKNAISHRFLAFRKLVSHLNSLKTI